jgi:hypothetical protein
MFLESYISLITNISYIDPLPSLSLPLTSLILFYILLVQKRRKLAFFLICFSVFPLASNNTSKRVNKIVNLGHLQEIIFRKNETIIFIDQRCEIEDMEIFCKKKPSNFGGPKF